MGNRLYSFSPATERARAPYKMRNTIMGGVLLLFAGSVYTYSIMAMKQDDFSDVATPPPSTKASAGKQ
ncbi:hypothetical protein BJ684DRAFT_12907 [Piptocephalis cylindrospora]|uniref:Cytochrome c oxidase assembly factor 3 n=1 Tax=Piptocephalis cylindrospora TaxID=1907219 RepID=A0A4P9XYF0_9FUNG|nr:hypothetical protein BJ684DRAFT_12907 [Piptocephalis cylindrospora]|eukprot:RKP11448.1 hypothetical protein BJ684DRAFT_12907 [Piptocephalis cylindrospora]